MRQRNSLAGPVLNEVAMRLNLAPTPGSLSGTAKTFADPSAAWMDGADRGREKAKLQG